MQLGVCSRGVRSAGWSVCGALSCKWGTCGLHPWCWGTALSYCWWCCRVTPSSAPQPKLSPHALPVEMGSILASTPGPCLCTCALSPSLHPHPVPILHPHHIPIPTVPQLQLQVGSKSFQLPHPTTQGTPKESSTAPGGHLVGGPKGKALQDGSRFPRLPPACYLQPSELPAPASARAA